MTFPRSALQRTLGVLLVAGALSCVDGPTAPRPLAIVTATPEALSLRPLDTATIVARVTTLDGVAIGGRPMEWRSLDTTIANVTTEGVVTASAYTGPAVRNTAILVTTLGASTDTVPVEVLPWAVGRVIASPEEVTLSPRDSIQLSLRLESAAGLELSGRTIAWIADDTNVVQVNAAGRARAQLYTGPLTRQSWIVVFSEGLADSIRVTVQPLEVASITVSPATTSLLPGQFDTLSAVVRSADGQALTETPLTWRSTDTTVVRVNEEGVITAMFYAGFETRVASVIVQFGDVADTTVVTVAPLAVGSVTIVSPATVVNPGSTLQLDASVRDAANIILSDRPITWSSSDATRATVSATGLVTALPYGGPDARSVQIAAASESVADTITLTLPPLEAAWLTATPEALSLFPLDTATVLATVTAFDLTVLSDRPLTWASLDDAVATVDANGFVTATSYTGPAVRSTAIVVTSSTATDTVPVTVTPFAVATVLASPSAVTLAPDDTTSLTLSLQAANGVVLTGRDRLWLSSDTAIVTVDALTGLVTARPYAGATERNADVVVYSEGAADTVAVTITPLVPASIAVAPDTVIIFPGEQSTFGATLRSASDTVLVGRPISWGLTDSTIASVNADGVVLGLFYVGPDERTTQVVAQNGVLSDTALVRVRALLVDSIAIFPDTQTLQAGQTAQLAAVVRDSAGLFLTGRAIEWTSSDPSRATVSDSGLVSALVAGTATITATSGGVSSQATITIVPVVTTVRVTPELSTVWIGREQPLSVALLDTNGVVPTERQVTWASSNPAIATVDTVGVVTALSTGLVTITATSEGRADSVSIDVFPEPAAAVTITFDDSWRGVLELAYPVMQELRLRGNVGWITSVDWSGVMNPTELRVLQDGGWSVVSHSMTHPYLTQLTPDSARFELEGSRARIASLGFDPRVFIAPYLDHNDAVLLESAAAGYTYTRCCAEDTWSTDTLLSWPIQPTARHRLAGVDVTNYEGQISSYNFRTADGRTRLRNLLLDVVAEGKFIDVFFHDILPEDVPDLRLTMEILAEFRPYLITYGMLP